MWRKARLETTSMNIRECSDSRPFLGCVSSMLAVLTQIHHSMMGDIHKKYCLRTSGTKTENILRLALSDNNTSHQLVYKWTG